MITFNLIPDIKRDYLNAKATRDRVMTWSILAAGSFVGLTIIASVIIAIQWFIVDSTKDDIANMSQELRNKDNIEEVLTVQNQLLTLPHMHEDKPKTTRIFSYLSTLTPENSSLNSLDIDMTENTMEISGSAESVRDANIFVDTLKGARYQLGPPIDDVEESFEGLSMQRDQDFSDMELDDPARAFSNVVSSLSIGSEDDVGFSVTLEYEPDIFDSTYSAVRMFIFSEDLEEDNEAETIFDDTDDNDNGEEQ